MTGKGLDARVLLADLGGTNVRFALADPVAASPLVTASIRRYRVAGFATFLEAARGFLREVDARPIRALFAVAGPVTGDEVRMTNHPWVLSRSRLAEELACDGLRIVNDFAAMAHCLPALGAADLQAIGELAAPRVDRSRRQTYAVVGPGTGLGVGALLIEEGRLVGLQTEGGHIGFAPVDAIEVEILRRLMQRFGRVSAERLLCGSGLVNLHRTLGEIEGVETSVSTPEAITAGAASDPRCRATLDRFCAMLGSFAGDFALAFGAWDGVCIGGGLTPHLLAGLDPREFRRRFTAKGRYADVLAKVSTSAIVHADAGLLGAAVMAVAERDRDARVAAGGAERGA